MGRKTLPGSQSPPQVPADNWVWFFLQHALSINVRGYFGRRTGKRSQRAVAFMRTPGKRSLFLNTKYLLVSLSCLPAGRTGGCVHGDVPLAWAGRGSMGTLSPGFIHRRLTAPGAGGSVSEMQSPRETRAMGDWLSCCDLPTGRLSSRKTSEWAVSRG